MGIFVAGKTLIRVLFVLVCLVASKAILAQETASPAHKLASSPAFLTKRLHIDTPNASWESLLKMITKQANINIVAEGAPRKKTLDFAMVGTLQEVLDALADKFDYTWKTTSSGVIVMNKRFQDGNEVPQVHYAEIKQVTKDVLAALSALPHDPHAEEVYQQGDYLPRWSQMLITLVKNLNPQQAATLRQGQRLGMADFSAEQRALLENVIYNNCFFATHGQWYGLMSFLNALPKGYLHAAKIPNSANYSFDTVDKDKKYVPTDIALFSTVITFPSTDPSTNP